MKARNQIEAKYKWDLSKYAKSVEEYETRLKQFEIDMQVLDKYRGQINTKNKDLIFEMLEKGEKLDNELSLLVSYIHLRNAEDVTNSEINELKEKLNVVCSNYSVLTSYQDVELTKLPMEFLKELQEDKRHPHFRNIFKAIIREKPYTLSLKEEELLSKLGLALGSSYDVFEQIDCADVTFEDVEDSKGKKHKLTNASANKYLMSDDRTLRKNTSVNYAKGFAKYTNCLATNFINNIKENVTLSRIKKYESCLQQALYTTQIDSKVYFALLENVNKNLDIVHKYYDVKRKALKLDAIETYDLSAPIVKKVNKKITYEDGVQLVIDALNPLGGEYVSNVRFAVDSRWVDVYENKGKDTGAFCDHCYGANPVILMNYQDDFNSVTTFAHEMGHCMHSYYSMKYQPSTMCNYGIFLAEIASTTNENLVCFHMINNTKSIKEKIYYLDQFLTGMRGTVYTQAMFAEFEEFAYNYYETNNTLSKDILTNKYYEVYKKYLGKSVKGVAKKPYAWERIPHFYYFFYVYKYATGFISASIITKRLLAGEDGFREKYIEFLSSGSSLAPLDTLAKINIDLTDNKTYEEVFDFFRQQVNELDELVTKSNKKKC